ncbi:MAG: phosphomannomutase/phosphoglucomutase, partial [Phycisphaerae bacterium]|nr:phosphomannomutase/phosphoglucomutase [Phycisphaerae bacterium]
MADIEKVFKAYDIRGLYPEQIDEDLAWRIGHAASQFLRTKLRGYERGQSAINRVVVGHDMRPHSKPLTEALIEGISCSGATSINIGMCDTPMIYFAINHLGACGGLQVTASHNPIEYNGCKISGYKACPIGETTGLLEIKHIVKSLRRMPSSAALAPIQQADLWDEYRKHVLQFLDMPRKLKIVADASNGMAGKMLPKIFGDVDSLEIIPLNFELGNGFVHPPNPLVAANMKWTQEAVIEHGADMGICLDGDADRCMFVDEKGQIVRCDIMTALLAKDFLLDNPGSTIVFDLRSSKVLPEVIREAGGVPRRERVGHAFMKKAMADTNAVFGGELSGHSYFRDNFHADSAAIVFARVASVLSASNTPLSEMVAPLLKYSHSGEINFQVEDKAAKMKEVEETFADSEIDHLDGVTCTYPDWWCNVRPSNTEPLLRLSLEAET